VPISWAPHVAPAPDYTIAPDFLKQIDWVVAQAHKNNLLVILDYHGDDALMQDPAANAPRFVASWKQFAEHYQSEPSSVLFELLNEPSHQMTTDPWNALLLKALAVVRPTNPDRIVIIGPARWNSIWGLSTLTLPEQDHRILVTFHFYDPHPFTHQGAAWIHGSAAWMGTTWQGTDAEKAAITKSFNDAAAWAQAYHRPLFLGEFGSFNQADPDSRARWTAFVARTAEAGA
jgi:endoglucanase